jgi:two-component system sensor kinase FixL
LFVEIVERRRSNNTSDTSEARFRAIFSRASVGIALIDRGGYAIESNPALRRMLGYSFDELSMMAFHEFVHPEDVDPCVTRFREMLAGRHAHYQVEKRFLRKNGDVMWGQLSMSMLREKEDGPAFGVAILEDVTEARLARQVLNEQLKFDAFLSNLSARFINLPVDQLDAAIEDAQRNICESLNLDVCTLWQLSPANPDSLFLTHYRVPPGFPPVPEVMDGKETFPWCLEKLRKGDSIVLSRVADAPAEAARDLEGWRYYGIKSSLTFPLSAGGSEVFGALGFNVISEPRDWPSELVSRLQLVAQIFANALARKRAEQALREGEARFRLLVDAAPVLIWISGTDKRCTHFNRPWLEFTGRTLEQELGDGWTEGVHPEDLQRCWDTYVRAFDAREPFSMDYRLRRHDGEYRFVLDNGAPLFGADQCFAGYIGSCIDITERRQHRELLKQEGAFLRQVLDITPNLIFAKDRQGRFTLANQAVANIYGTTIDALIGKTDADFNRNVEEVELFRRMDLEVMDTLQERFIAEEHVTDAAGKGRWLQTVKRPILDKDGTANQVLGSATDITARKHAELELAQQRNELAHLARVAMVGEMTSSLAHELNQPLTAILSNVQTAQRLLDNPAPDMAEIREILADIMSDDQRAGDIIRGLRGLLKKSELNFRQLDINDVILEVIGLIRSDALIKNVLVKSWLAPDLPAVRGDRIQLHQVMLNLAINALDAMRDVPVSERKLEIATSRIDPHSVQVVVQDAGTGIAPDQIEKVFEPFFTSKSQGLGIGLTICRSIINLHGGRIWVTNNAGSGVTFRFVMPISENSIS